MLLLVLALTPITDFGKEPLDGDIIMQAEHFLVNVISKKNESCNTFSELRVKLYHQSRDKIFIDLPCSSNEAHQNIRRAYMQVRLWIEAPFRNALEIMDPQDFGYVCNINENTVTPRFYSGPVKPLEVPEPCKCTNCTKRTCNCRVNEMACSDYCRCANTVCKNPCI